MNQVVKFFKKDIYLFLIIILTIPTFFSILRVGFFPMQDDLQAFRVYEMYKCFEDLQIPCRWVPDAGYQYGYPQFLYYPPSVYYLGAFLHFFGIQFIDAVKILFVLGFVLSTVLMYLFLKSVMKPWPAFFGAALYTYVPYKAVEVYVRGAMSEFWSLVVFPVIFWMLYQLVKTEKLKYVGWLALSVGFLMITHNLMTFIFAPAAIVWALTVVFLEKKKKKALGLLLLGGVLGFCLAAFFTLPVLFEKQYAHLETLLGGYFDYRQHFVDINQLFVSNHFGYGSSELGPGDDLSLSTGPLQFVFSVIAVVLALVTFRKNKKLSLMILTLFVTALLVLFMMHQKSSFIWEQLSALWYLQFPWRFLAVSIFLLSLISALGISLIDDKRVSYGLGILGILGVIFLHANFFMPREWINISDIEKFSGVSWQKQLTISIFDYLPIYAKLPPIQKAPEKPEVLEGLANFMNYSKGSNFQKGEVSVDKEVLIRLPLFDFPGMRVWVDGREVDHWYDDCRGEEFCLGLITFKVPTGQHNIFVKLTDTPIRTTGNALSLIGVLGVLVIFVKYAKN